MKDRCPTCRQFLQPEPKPKVFARICAACKLPIERHHKYMWVQVDGYTAVAHRQCDNPFLYLTAASRAAAPGREDEKKSSDL